MFKRKKLPRTISRNKHRTGTIKSKKRDLKRKALTPGLRISKSGKTYYEARKNRSDRKGKKL